MDLALIVDQDGNTLRVIKPSEDLDMLLVRVTDENDVPVGMFLEVDAAVALRGVLDTFIASASQ